MFHFLYMDETYDDGQRYLIIASFICPASLWREINKGIYDLKEKYFGQKEFNLKAIRTSNKIDRGIRSKWNELGSKKQEKFRSELAGVVTKPSCCIIASLIDKDKMVNKDRELQFELAHSFIMQRFDYFLQEHNGYGVMIMDEAVSSPVVTKLSDRHKGILQNGLPVKYLVKFGRNKIPAVIQTNQPTQRVVENLIFQDDNDSNFIQVADLVAAAISQKYNNGNDTYYRLYESIIRRNPENNKETVGYGLKIFPL